ncbi:D-alanine--D-alanine ligase [Streptococcus cuniculi]|uniref:D-alanine--D-alanine ligase n=1 Tax=Streptococcus cuniculi TaxID=1432788 RepID=A0A4Y9J935_9STRE|nr:D-alanine--D-alanine ligase [Streptococcus cuniculi]MBF0779310.1 D-alanine--D-alanine ligase [Streptococcus cuniculi]TFU96688.1 D-alanine--D-alanine ligase [Streptococcus cuniculi]
MNKAVVLGCNYYIGLSIIRCLGREGVDVVACDYDFKDSYGAKSTYIREFLQVANFNENEQQTLSDLMEYGKHQAEKPVLLPSHDKYVEFIDRYYDELEEYYLISQAKGLNSQLLDKWVLHDIAHQHGVRVPATIHSQDEQLFERVVNELGFPCIIKPFDTVIFTKIFRNKVFICHNEDELKIGIQKAKENDIDVFVQEIIPGFDDCMLTYDFHIDRTGKTSHYMTAQKQRQWPINFGASVFTIQKYNQKLVDISKPFLEAIGYRGFGEIEFKQHDKTGEIYLIEINARTTNFNHMIYKVGLNMPYIAYLDLTGQLKESDYKYIDYNTNYAFIYGFEDVVAIWHYWKTGQVGILKSLKISFSKKWAPAIFSISDIRPWLFFNQRLLGKVVNKMFRRK